MVVPEPEFEVDVSCGVKTTDFDRMSAVLYAGIPYDAFMNPYNCSDETAMQAI